MIPYIEDGLNEAKQETPFRIGGIYRNAGGDLVRLLPLNFKPHAQKWGSTFPGETIVQADRVLDGFGCGYIRLGLGLHVGGSNIHALIPGELDESGNPIPSFYAAIEPAQSRTPTLDKLEQQKEKQRPRLTWADSKAADRFADFTVTSGGFSPFQAPRHALQASPDLSPTGHLVKADHALAAVRQLVR